MLTILFAVSGLVATMVFLVQIRLWIRRRQGIGLGRILVESTLGLLLYLTALLFLRAASVAELSGNHHPMSQSSIIFVLGLGSWIMLIRLLIWWYGRTHP